MTTVPPADVAPGHVWTERQFGGMSWHDNHVHGLQIREGAYGCGELVLDIDYIEEWLCSGPDCQFRIVPARLTFREVSALRVALDYATPTAALGPFSIHAIERREEQRERYVAQVWRIALNWPVGEITFEAKGFEQRVVGAPVLSRTQWLRPAERGERA
jgi:hypothetical protein